MRVFMWVLPLLMVPLVVLNVAFLADSISGVDWASLGAALFISACIGVMVANAARYED